MYWKYRIRHSVGVKEFQARHDLLEMTGAAIEAMGPRRFFEVVPLDLQMDRYGGPA